MREEQLQRLIQGKGIGGRRERNEGMVHNVRVNKGESFENEIWRMAED